MSSSENRIVRPIELRRRGGICAREKASVEVPVDPVVDLLPCIIAGLGPYPFVLFPVAALHQKVVTAPSGGKQGPLASG